MSGCRGVIERESSSSNLGDGTERSECRVVRRGDRWKEEGSRTQDIEGSTNLRFGIVDVDSKPNPAHAHR